MDQERFARAFETELKHMRERTGPREVTSIFLGGGTPSLMKPETVARVLDAVAKNWTVPDGIEVTLEANPSSVEAERFRGYRSAGVNRVSLGVQALNDKDLRFLGRLHNVEEALHDVVLEYHPSWITRFMGLGFKVQPLGLPDEIEGDPVIAVHMQFDERALKRTRKARNVFHPVLAEDFLASTARQSVA